MNQNNTGKIIRQIREKQKISQAELAEKLYVSSKTISKWETGAGFPDVSLLEDIAKVLNISLNELFTGNMMVNHNIHANMLNSKFYVCPLCGNIISSVGETSISCHGLNLLPLEATETTFDLEIIEDEYFIQLNSPMTKSDYISFIAGVSSDRVELVKLYQEGPAMARIKMRGVKYLYYFHNRDGLFKMTIKKRS